jgi:hypothetical protein
MADINQQTEELARKFEQLAQAMGQYDQLTKSSADQKRDADVQAATGIKNFTKGAAAGADAVGELAGAAISAGKSMLEGKKGAAAFNDSIDGMAKAAQAAGVALALLICTVWIALAGPNAYLQTRHFHFPGTRHDVRTRSTLSALAMLHFALKDAPLPRLLWQQEDAGAG